MDAEFRHEHRREALIGTIVLNGLLALLFFLIVFKNPPEDVVLNGGGGVELNYGLDETGFGDNQTSAPANESPSREDSRPPAQQPDPEPQQARQPVTPTEEAQPEKVVTSEAEETDVKIPPVEKPSPKPREEPVKEPEPEKPKVNPRAVFTPRGATANTGGNGTMGTSNNPAGNNNGDDPGTVGDKGDPRGTYSGKAYSGDPGEGGGSGGGFGSGKLNMPGWAFDHKPNDQDPSDEVGFVTLKIKIDENGDVESVTVTGSSVTPRVANFYRDMIQNKATFRRVGSGSGGATGTITYRIGGK
ncbi:energy transducer TonB [Hymenobacter latericus]|uniref:hypothetical protein n=1 Tax=Hymenobacter sp. YIM 151858-1 TaxID=2987688 RepID=UPI00222677DB|nr:hypothetical protein [Hymenobacter sp. YIM 151858-1]UYZ60251.1 hypothetical protein OIS50_05475 [Hymenobacter sp. YIM 151858-1]